MTTDSRDSPRTPDPASRPSPGSAPAPTVGPVPRAGVADHDLTSRTARSVLWTVLRSGVTNVLQIVVYFTLLALLVPEDFGLVAAATVFIATISFLVNGGFAEALIQRSELTGRQINTAFWAGNAIAAVMTCGTLLFAFLGPFDRFFDDPRIVWILAALTLHLPLTALISVPQALLAREMRFKTLAKVEVIAALASSATGIGVALAGGGAWALVMQTMTQRALTVAGCWVAAGWRPAFEFDRAEVKPLVSFGSSLVGVRFMEHLANYADQFLVGGFLSLAALGIYQVGQRVSEQVLVVMYLTVGATALPALAKLQGDRDRLNRVTVGGSQLLVFLGVPMFVGLAVIAPDFVLLFDEEWEGAGPLLKELLPAAVPAFEGVSAVDAHVRRYPGA
ncbi:MAG: lipopolysaccharide biosynthesis protein, partial [Planctomycetota bacterium]